MEELIANLENEKYELENKVNKLNQELLGKGTLKGDKEILRGKIAEEFIQCWDKFQLIQDELELATTATVEIKRT